MALWSYEFNIEEDELREKDNNIVKKFALSTVLTDKLKIEPDNFIQDSCHMALTKLNKSWDLSKMDPLFFPIVEEGHWVLVSVNMFLKEICWFNSLGGSHDTKYFVSAKNVVTNFSKACLQPGVLNKDISLFDWKYPTDYPHQKSFFFIFSHHVYFDNPILFVFMHDYGLYTMLYMESWNGKKMDTTFEPHMIANYRKLVAGILLLSPRNDILTSEFVEKYCN
ncbi:hypothetical protein SETIT_8G103800v2 [Setaria italica]|uniref:Ubiquitin-like protease family profile domain-containing protein n=1 Tax=Setaria italica TaxID=4555 RepID=A0A368S6I1_SETIT|nr:hypothetical protein SETIT_8G103800v2 [Setaria italica]